MSDPPPPRGDNPLLAPLADAPAAAPMDRAAAEAVRMEAERIISPNRRAGNAPHVSLTRSSTGTCSERRPGSSARTTPAAPQG